MANNNLFSDSCSEGTKHKNFTKEKKMVILYYLIYITCIGGFEWHLLNLLAPTLKFSYRQKI